VSRWLSRFVRSARGAPRPEVDPPSPAASIYIALTELQRDQLSAQLEQANGNDLLAIAEIGAAIALVIGIIIVRVTYQQAACWRWWWWPIPGFVLGTFMAGVPLIPPTRNRKYMHGPRVPDLLTKVGTDTTVEAVFRRLIQDFQSCWANNDALLARESWWLKWGGISLVVFGLVTVGLYTWALS